MTMEPANVPSSSPVASASSAVGSTSSAPAGFELPFDPLRLVAAILRKWHWILLSAVLPALLGGAAGYFKFESHFTASTQLMRQEMSGSFRSSESGETFKPRQVSVPTLVSLMKSATLLQRVSEQTQPRLAPRAILGDLTITPERNTDLITVTFRSARSAEAALRVLNTLGAEVVKMVRDMQAQEAADVNRLYKQQIAKGDEDLRRINQELLAFAKEAGLVSVDKEMDARLGRLGSLDFRYETLRIDYETLDLRIQALEKELTQHNPLAERLDAAKEKLAGLRSQFTDANPAVADQIDRVAELERMLPDAGVKQILPPRQGESAMAASFYQELLTLRTQKEVLAAQLEKLKAVRVTEDAKLRELPEKGMQYARIKAREQSVAAAQALLASRQREAQLYEENPPGYYKYFEAKPDQVEIAGRGKKLMMVSAGGGVLGLFLSVAFVCLIESMDDRIKTIADAKRATKLPLLAALPDFAGMDAVAQADWAFRTWMALQARLAGGPNQSLVCGITAAADGEGCSTWVELLARAAAQRENPILAVIDRQPLNGVTTDLAAALGAPAEVVRKAGSVTWLVTPQGFRWDPDRRRQWWIALEEWQKTPGLVLLLEIKSVEQPETLLLAERIPQLIWLSGGSLGRVRLTMQRLEILRHAKCRFVGMVFNREKKLFPSMRV